MIRLRPNRPWFAALAIVVIAFATSAYNLPSPNPAESNNADFAELEKISRSVSGIAKKAEKALVFVSISKTVKGVPNGLIDPFEFFFGPGMPNPRRQQEQPKQSGLGSGFFVDMEKGYILTNNHVVDEADEISLKLANGQTYDGKVVGRDKKTDVAVVKINDEKFNRKGLGELALGDSEKTTVGDFVVALGAPFGLEASLSFGIVSALGRGSLGISTLGDFIQTDAAINPGNSGGPLLNIKGEVIGINTAIFSRSGGYNGIGFAIPSNLTRLVAEQLINEGKVSRGLLGVYLQPMSDELAQDFGMPAGEGGALVSSLNPGSPAEKGGLKEGDVITAVDDKKIKDSNVLQTIIGLKKPGTQVVLNVYRDGKEMKIKVKLGTFKEEQEGEGDSPNTPGTGEGGDESTFGMNLSKITDPIQKRFGFESKAGAVVTAVAPGSPAQRAGVQPGDVLLSVNNNAVANPGQFVKQIAGKKRLLIRIERAGEYFFVSLRR